MSIVVKQIKTEEEYTKYWNQLNAHLMQSWQWGVVKSGSSIPIYLAVFEEDEPKHVVMIQRKQVLGGFIKFGYAPKTNISRKVVETLKEFLKQNLNLDFVIFEPSQEADFELGLSDAENIQPHYTNAVDLTIGEEKVWMNFKGKYRRNIKKAEREGVKVKLYTQGEEAIKAFDEIMSHIITHTNYVMTQGNYFSHVWKTLSEAYQAKILVAYSKEDELLGAYLVACDQKSTYELYGGVNIKGRDLEAGYILKWEAMKAAMKAGKHEYDHWGTAPFDENDFDKSHEMYNISRFKLGFGGRNVKFANAQAMVFKPFKYSVFKVLNKFRKLKLKLMKSTK